MAKKRKLPRSRVRERPARAPRLQLVRFEQCIARYLGEVRTLKSETSRSHRFTVLLNELFGELPISPIHDYLSGLESGISTYEGEKCRVLRGRPDALFGNIVIEFEARFPTKLKEARSQLQRYLTILHSNPETAETHFIPIATDGISFRVLAPVERRPARSAEDLELEEIERFDLSESNIALFYYWVDRLFVRREERKPTAEHFVQDFGIHSPAFREATLLWGETADRLREHSDFRVIYETWQAYLRTAYGSVTGDLSLFLRHTFLATLGKLIAYARITGTRQLPEDTEIDRVLLGSFFEDAGILNFLEEDFFSWVSRPPAREVTRRIARSLLDLLFTYQLRELSEDVLKELYQQIVGREDRHGLGEYYTPDWLAAAMCERLLGDRGEETVLDPACGSGTFLYQVIQHRRRRIPPGRQSAERLLRNVVGIDIHPLAVIISKINVLLALGDAFKKRQGPVAVQVYLANAIRPPSDEVALGAGGANARRVELNHRAVLIPTEVLTSPDKLDAFVRVAQDFARAHADNPRLEMESFRNHCARQMPEFARAENVVTMWFDLAGLLHEFIRKPEDSIWAYILKNLYKPNFLKDKFDIVIGNPPWLSFRFVERGEYQTYLRKLVGECRLLEGSGHLITHLELGTVFFARCAEYYLKPKGRIGFVLPRSIFTADQHDRFRRSMTRGNSTLVEVWDLEGVVPLFNVPAAVAIADLESDVRTALLGRIFKGELRRRNASAEEAKQDLGIEKTTFHIVQQGKHTYLSTTRKRASAARSYYQPHFKEGATIVPRNFWFVEIRADQQLGLNPRQPLVVTDPRAEVEAKPPYKGVRFEGPIESDFIYGTLLSTDLLPFGHFGFRPVVLPLVQTTQGYSMLSADTALAYGYLRLAEWIDRAQRTWQEKRKEKAARGDVLQWLNYRNKLIDQNPEAKYVVLYPMSATYLCAAAVSKDLPELRIGGQAITLRGFLADYVSFYYETDDRLEANFVAAVLNAPLINEKVKPLQAKGLWGPRHLCKKVLELPIPQFNPGDERHRKLSELAETCAKKTTGLKPELATAFSTMRGPHAIGRARSAVRKALADELAQINSLVKQILE